MAKMPSSFNAAASEKMGDYTPIPEGEYNMKVVSSEMKETKDGNGTYLELKLEVIEGEHARRTLYERLNLQNANPKTVEIAQKSLASLCEACGVDVLDDSEQLHGIPIEVKLAIRPARAQYGESNTIKGYKSLASGGGGGGAATPGRATPPAKKPGAAKATVKKGDASKTPWKSKK